MFYGVWCHSTLWTDIWYAAGDAGLVTVQKPTVTRTLLGKCGTDRPRQQMRYQVDKLQGLCLVQISFSLLWLLGVNDLTPSEIQPVFLVINLRLNWNEYDQMDIYTHTYTVLTGMLQVRPHKKYKIGDCPPRGRGDWAGGIFTDEWYEEWVSGITGIGVQKVWYLKSGLKKCNLNSFSSIYKLKKNNKNRSRGSRSREDEHQFFLYVD